MRVPRCALADSIVTRNGNNVIRWLLEGDAAIRWQVLRDLLGSTEGAVERERRKIAREGWGARLLARQDPRGTWGGGLYTPKWTSTTYTMLLLRDLGLPPSNGQAQRACSLLLDNGLRPDGGVNFARTDRSETCISGMTLSIVSYFRYDDERLDTIADHLLEQQMPDGGWNCRHWCGATHASVHTTISVLEGLRLYELHRRRKIQEMRKAQRRAPRRSHRHRPYEEAFRRPLVVGELLQGQIALRTGAPWHAEPLEHAPCLAGPEVVGNGNGVQQGEAD